MPSSRQALSKKVRLGQFYTSDHVTDLMVEMTDQPPTAATMEPGFGEGAFLKALQRAGFSNVVAYDVDRENYTHVTKQFGSRFDLRCCNYLETPRDEVFNLIIGNPPYVQWNNIDPKTRELLQAKFWQLYVNGEWDLLYAFIIWSVEKLSDGGELIFIVPYNWFNATYAATLRAYLVANGSFETLIHFSEFKLFDDCAPNALIFKYRKGARRFPYVKVAEFDGRSGDVKTLLDIARGGLCEPYNESKGESREGDWRFFSAQHPKAGQLWHLATPLESRRISKLERVASERLGKRFDVAVGMVSGRDAAFALTELEYEQLPESERGLVRTFAKARGCSRYRLLHTSKFIYADSIDDEDLLRRDYPTIYARLLAHKSRLSDRYGAKSKPAWWHWATVRNLAVFERNRDRMKLFVPGIDRSPRSRFCVTEQDILGAGDVICIAARSETAEDLLYVLGWLNSDAVNDWYRVKGSRTGHRTRYTQAYVAQMPFRTIDFADPDDVKLHDEVVAGVRIALTTDLGSPERTAVEAKIEESITKLLKRRA